MHAQVRHYYKSISGRPGLKKPLQVHAAALLARQAAPFVQRKEARIASADDLDGNSEDERMLDYYHRDEETCSDVYPVALASSSSSTASEECTDSQARAVLQESATSDPTSASPKEMSRSPPIVLAPLTDFTQSVDVARETQVVQDSQSANADHELTEVDDVWRNVDSLKIDIKKPNNRIAGNVYHALSLLDSILNQRALGAGCEGSFALAERMADLFAKRKTLIRQLRELAGPGHDVEEDYTHCRLGNLISFDRKSDEGEGISTEDAEYLQERIRMFLESAYAEGLGCKARNDLDAVKCLVANKWISKRKRSHSV